MTQTTNVHFNKVLIVGVGLIGGSLGLALKKAKMADRILGVGRSKSNLDEALQLGAIDEVVSLAQGAAQALSLIHI